MKKHERGKSTSRVDNLYTYTFSLHERGFTIFYDNHSRTTDKRLEVTKMYTIIYERGKENENRVSINKRDIKTHTTSVVNTLECCSATTESQIT